MAGEPSGVDLPVVASLDDVKKIMAEMEVMKVQIVELQNQIENLAAQIGSFPEDVKAAAKLIADHISKEMSL